MAKPVNTSTAIRQLARHEVRPEALDRCLAAIHEFVSYVRAREPGTLRYEVWQQPDHPTPDGSGTITFEIPPPSNIAIDDATAMLMKRSPDPTFDNIDHVASVHELIVRVWEGLQPTA